MSIIQTIVRSRRLGMVLPLIVAVSLSACGGGGGYGGGGGSGGGGCGYYGCSSSSSSSSSSSMSSSSSSSAVGGTAFSITLQPQQVVPATNSAATATGSIVVDYNNGDTTGSIMLTGVAATAVTINDAFAGNNGTAVLTLTQSTTDANMWNASGNLSADQLTDLAAGKLYALVTSSGFPNGELRAQILPSSINVVWAAFSGAQEVPAVTSAVTGVVAVTVNNSTSKAAINVNISIDTATGVETLTGSSSTNGSLLATLVVDGSMPGHWMNENVTLTANDIANFNASKWYANVYTAANSSGEVRAQIAQTPPTFTQLQDNIFTPICSHCHNGQDTQLPGVQNLTSAANSYSMLVNVSSLEVSSLKRIKPRDPDNSYLIQKIEGTAAQGEKMPLGGQLTQDQIDQLRAWVTAGAPNN